MIHVGHAASDGPLRLRPEAVQRDREHVLLVASLVIALVGMAWLSLISTSSRYVPDVLLPLLVIGIGQGIAIILMTQGGVAGVHPQDGQLAGPPSRGPGSRGWYSGRSFALANAPFTAAESAVMSYAP